MQGSFSTRFINLAAALGAAGALLFAPAGGAQARDQDDARVSISEQTLQVPIDGQSAFRWKVPTAARGYVTPTKTFRPTRTHKMWYSCKYDNAPMPHSVFFHGGYAVHAADAIKRLGRSASHGCIRLRPDNASDFYTLVESVGPANTSMVIVR